MATRTAASPPAGGPQPRTADLPDLPPDGSSHVRGDIEGLRAIAVLLVIGDHLLGWPHGGFVGVDVFFVISGFLITGLLLREHQRHRRISFADFYRRRVRRILPASVLVLAVTTIAANVVFFGSRARETQDDALWSLLFAGNWRFAVNGTDYLHADGPVSPLQHFWSLGVEEQFYLVWPALLAVVLALAGWQRRHRRKRRRGPFAVMAVLVAAGLAWALHETVTAPTWAYFSTSSRAWELGLGALLAIAAPLAGRIPAALRPALGWAGVAGIAAAALLLDRGATFPAPGALLPVLATAAVIAAGTGGDSRLRPLCGTSARYLGALSYSLYLWHFPVVVVLGALMPSGVPYVLVSLALTAAASVASYHLVEQPVRRSDWLRPGAPPSPRRRRANRWVAVAAASALAAVLVAGQATGAGWPWERTADAGTPAAAPAPAGPDLDSEITEALAADAWPQLQPSLDELGDRAWAPEWIEDDCLNVLDDADVARCRYGDPEARRTAVVLGDSIAISWMPGIRGALEDAGWAVQSLTSGQCPQVPVRVRAATGIPGFADSCAEHQQWAMEQVQRLQPDLVVVSAAGNSARRLESGATGDAALAEWRAGYADMLTGLDAATDRVVVLGPPPEGADLQECATRFNTPRDCVSSPQPGYDDLVRAEREAVEGFSGERLTAGYVDVSPWFCDPAGRCPSFVGTTPVFADGGHPAGAYTRRLAPLLARAVLG
ncbi:acyltransferase family protein [Blastococcus sp. SYSU D00695]